MHFIPIHITTIKAQKIVCILLVPLSFGNVCTDLVLHWMVNVWAENIDEKHNMHLENKFWLAVNGDDSIVEYKSQSLIQSHQIKLQNCKITCRKKYNRLHLKLILEPRYKLMNFPKSGKNS